uniref:AAA family ATPase n=1 Tax=Eubacterium sp. TaxID=142586 RepID=UPI003FF0CD84
MAQLAYHISTGTPLWNFDVKKGTVLYLALEDDYHRLQERLYRMFGTESTDNLYFSVSAGQLGNGLDEQLTRFMAEHPDTKLIIVDTLQKVREVGGDNYSYANDYEIITRLKKFADSYGICLLLVHHTRKQNSDDKFDMISGTNGLLGAADGGFILRKEKRTSNSATLEVLGRDQPDQKIYLNRNPETLVWELERAETELWKLPPEPLLENIAGKITNETPEWYGSPTELVEFLGADMKANALTMKLNINAGRLFNEYGITYQNKRCHDGHKVSLSYEQRDDV